MVTEKSINEEISNSLSLSIGSKSICSSFAGDDFHIAKGIQMKLAIDKDSFVRNYVNEEPEPVKNDRQFMKEINNNGLVRGIQSYQIKEFTGDSFSCSSPDFADENV